MAMLRSGFQLTERNLVLTGYTEPNKPRIARQVAEQLRMRFVNVEELIEQRTGESVTEIRLSYGEHRLKTVESEIMEEVLLYRNAVIRVNGSTLVHSDHYEQLEHTSIMICLVARLDAILQQMHLVLGSRYHDPTERGMQLGLLRREWAVRSKPNLHEIDATDYDADTLVQEVIALWEEMAVGRR